MKTFMAGMLVGLAVAGGVGFAIGGMQARRVDDWRHIHAWGSWSNGPGPDSKVVLIKICTTCGLWQVKRM